MSNENQILSDMRQAISLLPPKQPETVILTSERNYRRVKLILGQQVEGSIVMRARRGGMAFLCGIRVEARKDMPSIIKRAKELEKDGLKALIFHDDGRLAELMAGSIFQQKQQTGWNATRALHADGSMGTHVHFYECLRWMNRC